MSTSTHSFVPAAADVPLDRFYHLNVEKYQRMGEGGIFQPDDRVELREGVVFLKHPTTDSLADRAYHFSLEQYHRMEAEGILLTKDRVELLGGWLIARPPMNPPHRRATRKVRVEVEKVLPRGWYADEQKPVSMPLTSSEPEPDLQVVRGDPDDYNDRHPGPNEIALLVEVSDSTLSEDRQFQKQLYASEGVPVYWILNLRQRCLEVFWGPSGPGETPDYRGFRSYSPVEDVPLILDGREVASITVRNLLP